jgi:hypothetical protein
VGAKEPMVRIDKQNRKKYRLIAKAYRRKYDGASVSTLMIPTVGPIPLQAQTTLVELGFKKSMATKLLFEMSVKMVKENYRFAGTHAPMSQPTAQTAAVGSMSSITSSAPNAMAIPSQEAASAQSTNEVVGTTFQVMTTDAQVGGFSETPAGTGSNVEDAAQAILDSLSPQQVERVRPTSASIKSVANSFVDYMAQSAEAAAAATQPTGDVVPGDSLASL